MKKLLFIFILIPFLGLSQVQIGNDINGESAGDQSGTSVSTSADGNIVAIGSPYNNENGARSGQVRIYENQNGNWVQIGSDINGQSSGDNFGYSVSLSSNGSIVAIGMRDSNAIGFGKVQIYENQNGSWIQIGLDIVENFFSFGASVSLSSDGNVIAIGTFTSNGYVRIYENQNDNWIQIGSNITREESSDYFGKALSLSSNGNVIAIGAFHNSGNGTNSGHVRIFEYQSGNWIQLGSDIDGESTGDASGWSVSLSSNGSIIAIGAYQNDGNGSQAGHVRVYENQNNNWVQIGSDIDGEAAEDLSGSSVSLSSDGSIVAIGAPINDDGGINTGHVRIYQNQAGNWVQIGTDIDGDGNYDYFGSSISLSSDGTVLAIGALYNDGNGVDSGQVKVFDLSGELSTENQTISNFNIYPNPTKGQFTIQLEHPSDLQNVNIYNNLGQLVLTTKESVINTLKLATGLYVLELETTKGKGSKKLIIE
ncbi:T9SS type A sorting domain-containing protein [Winogradskyella pulchriflava]|uniref:T9SS type A sorting domain-containing protein n=1 Tax=Winogradskyella pulchriflava TaxID=1110688 RepID=A0ABV6Q6X2_9FLAO